MLKGWVVGWKSKWRGNYRISNTSVLTIKGALNKNP